MPQYLEDEMKFNKVQNIFSLKFQAPSKAAQHGNGFHFVWLALNNSNHSYRCHTCIFHASLLIVKTPSMPARNYIQLNFIDFQFSLLEFINFFLAAICLT